MNGLHLRLDHVQRAGVRFRSGTGGLRCEAERGSRQRDQQSGEKGEGKFHGWSCCVFASLSLQLAVARRIFEAGRGVCLPRVGLVRGILR